MFSAVKFGAKFEFVLQKQFLSVVANHSKSESSTVNCLTKAKKFVKCIPEILSNTTAVRVENSTEINSVIT